MKIKTFLLIIKRKPNKILYDWKGSHRTIFTLKKLNLKNACILCLVRVQKLRKKEKKNEEKKLFLMKSKTKKKLSTSLYI